MTNLPDVNLTELQTFLKAWVAESSLIQWSGLGGFLTGMVYHLHGNILAFFICCLCIGLFWFFDTFFGSWNAASKGKWNTKDFGRSLRKLIFYGCGILIAFAMLWMGSLFPAAGFNLMAPLTGSVIMIIFIIEGLSALHQIAIWSGSKRLAQVFGNFRKRGDGMVDQMTEVRTQVARNEQGIKEIKKVQIVQSGIQAVQGVIQNIQAETQVSQAAKIANIEEHDPLIDTENKQD